MSVATETMASLASFGVLAFCGDVRYSTARTDGVGSCGADEPGSAWVESSRDHADGCGRVRREECVRHLSGSNDQSSLSTSCQGS